MARPMSMGIGDPCDLPRPLTFMLGGPEVVAAAAARASLVFNPAFPCGVERGQTFSAGDDIPLVVLGRWSGYVGPYECQQVRDRRTGEMIEVKVPAACPGDRVIIRGHVGALQSTRGPGLINPLAIGECEGISTYPRIKLSVFACGWAQPIIIDADSQIIVPAGMIRIDVLGPGPSTPASSDFGLESWSEGPQTLGAPRLWVDVNLRITACPLTACDCPPGVLSEYLHTVGDDAAVAIANRILLRPRRAKRLEISPLLPTGAAIGLLLDTTATLPLIGQVVFGTGAPAGGLFQIMEIFGAWPAFFTSNSAGGTQRLAIRWEIV